MKDDRKTATKKEMHNFDDLMEINIRVTMGGTVLRNVKVLPLV